MASYDIVVFGATSFVGQLVCRHLWQRYGADGELRWAMAGRSREKLESVQRGLGAEAATVPLIVADSSDEGSLETMVQQTRVVLSTVGPYALYGTELVKVCAERGVDYCDLTGEVQWIARMIDRFEATAKGSGARIVHCAGFDSVPSDLGVHFLQREAMDQFGAPCKRVKFRLKAASGGFSGGTVASLINALKEASADPKVRKRMADPYALCPSTSEQRPRQPDVRFKEYDPDAKSWVAPFIMAAINTRVVHRSNALLGYAWGYDFQYDEAVMTGRGAKGWLGALAAGGGLAGLMGAVALPPTRWVMERFVLPKPGEGPSPEAQEKGFFDVRLFGTTERGETLAVKVYGERDPGYGATSRMIGEVAAAMATQAGEGARAGGFFTPSVLLGDALLERLQAHAGMRFERLSP
ncbi:MAG: saccharopine dehydrogenase NADP-binding domain-containing protein [Algiphilus sp.]|uniref:saccharopine dehydrogenase family protein n=2 Tax=Algiphilus sp. TaxID=1872431 RepID=UPI0032EB30D2